MQSFFTEASYPIRLCMFGCLRDFARKRYRLYLYSNQLYCKLYTLNSVAWVRFAKARDNRSIQCRLQTFWEAFKCWTVVAQAMLCCCCCCYYSSLLYAASQCFYSNFRSDWTDNTKDFVQSSSSVCASAYAFKIVMSGTWDVICNQAYVSPIITPS